MLEQRKAKLEKSAKILRVPAAGLVFGRSADYYMELAGGNVCAVPVSAALEQPSATAAARQPTPDAEFPRLPDVAWQLKARAKAR